MTLLFSSAVTVNSLLPNGNTALGYAIQLGRDDIIPGMYACVCVYVRECVTLSNPVLIDGGASVRVPSGNGMTAIHMAVSCRSPISTLQHLMRQEAGCENDCDTSGRPPLLIALEGGNADAAMFIAKTFPHCCRVVVEGSTMLHYCLIFRSHNLVRSRTKTLTYQTFNPQPPTGDPRRCLRLPSRAPHARFQGADPPPKTPGLPLVCAPTCRRQQADGGCDCSDAVEVAAVCGA